MTVGFVLASAITLTLPDLGFSAARSIRRSGRFRIPAVHRERPFSPRSHGSGLFASDGSGGGQVVIIQQFPSPAPAGTGEPAKSQIYVSPRWEDAGQGVQVLQPGYWTEPKQPTQQ
jgi:hypothetical protein